MTMNLWVEVLHDDVDTDDGDDDDSLHLRTADSSRDYHWHLKPHEHLEWNLAFWSHHRWSECFDGFCLNLLWRNQSY